MMSPSIHGERIVETLLNALEVERYVRGPLLATVVAELSAARGLGVAADMARTTLERLDSGTLEELEFRARICALRQLVLAVDAPVVPAELEAYEWRPGSRNRERSATRSRSLASLVSIET